MDYTQLLINKTKELNWYYCLGLFFSDGNFRKENNRLKCFLNEKDKQIIFDVADFLECEVKHDSKQKTYGIDFCNKFVSQLIEQYDINNRKTYYPCNISNIKDKELIAFIVGFIDGDGSVHKRTDGPHCNIIIKLHISWYDNLSYISNSLYSYFEIKKAPKPTIITTKDGKQYAQIIFGNQKVIRGLLNFIKTHKLLHLNRKWDKLKDFYPHIRKDNSSGVIGVYLEANKYWCAYITVNGQYMFLGCFKEKEKAIIARLKKEKELFSKDAPQYHLFETYNI